MAKNRKSTYFANIVIQSKDDKEDFRAFVHCRDIEGEWWELRGTGRTAGEAADNAWLMYLDNQNWDVYGYITEPPKKN